MRILILSFYYPPDIGPGPLRAEALVKALKTYNKNLKIDVMTTLPNRYYSITLQALDREVDERVNIYRHQLPKHYNGMFDQARAFFKYFKNSLSQTKDKKYDVVVATSSRLFTAVLGVFIAKRCDAKLYLDIRDLFSDTMKDVLRINPLRILLPALRLLEKWTFESADKINVVSGGFLSYIKDISINGNISVLTNGIDESFVKFNFKKVSFSASPVILYAGNIGKGQGLEKIVPTIAQSLPSNFSLTLIGEGGQRRVLENNISLNKISNVRIIDPMPRKVLMGRYKDADILFLHLNDFDAFKKVLPSKIFEYAATGKPILAGVHGYAASFLIKNVVGVFVFYPNDVYDMKKSLRALMEGPSFYDRSIFIKEHMRDEIMRKVAKDIISL